MAKKVIKGEQVTKPYLISEDILSGASVGTWQKDYLLQKHDFYLIKNGKSKTFSAAQNFLFASFCWGLSLIAKGYPNFSDIKKGEWIALGVGIAISVVLYAIGYFLPNERKEIMKKIEEHFKKAPTIHQVIRKDS